MASTGAVLLGLVVLGGVVVLAFTANGAGAKPVGNPGVGGSLPTPPSGGASAGSRGPCGAASSPPVIHRVTSAQNGVTYPIRVADSLQTWLYISQAGYDWVVKSSDPSILYSDRHTSGPDANDPNGSDAVDYWVTQGKVGTATITGQLLPKNGGVGATSIANFSLTIQVVCG